jgi:GntR family transcriptional regulator
MSRLDSYTCPSVDRVGPRDVIKRNTADWYYEQLAADLEERIKSGEWEPGTLLPSEKQLMQEYNLARGTVRRALQVLVEKGLVYKRAGRGTIVNRNPKRK